MTNITGKTFKDVYQQALDKVVNNPDFVTSPRGYTINELMDVTLTIQDITKNLFTNSYRGIPLNYLRKEIALYLSRRNDAKGFIEAAKFWETIKTDSDKINSAYGFLIFTPELAEGLSQFDWAYECLSKDKDSRQAVMFFNRPDYQYSWNKDFICTLNTIFHIRENKLYMRTNMRSNDIRRGMQFDIPFFMLLQYLMYLMLKDTVYPDLELGSYSHYAASLHIYHNLTGGESDVEMAKKMLAAEWGDAEMPLPDDASVIMNPIVKAISFGEVPQIKPLDMNYDFYRWLLK